MSSPKKFLVLAKVETTQFTDAAPTAALNAMLVTNLKVKGLNVKTQPRQLMRPYFGNSEQIIVSEEATISFDVELAGAGAAGTAPKWGPLLRACGFSETINAGTDVQYSPVSSGFEFVTLYCYRDGIVYKMTGAIGSVALAMSAGAIPRLTFNFLGRYVALSDAAIPAGSDYSGFQQPRGSIPLYTPTVTINGYAAIMSAFSFDLSGELSHAVWMNADTNSITDRQPKGSATVQMVTVATMDYHALAEAGTLVPIAIQHGTTAGNIVKFDAPKVQIGAPDEDTFENTLAWKLDLTFMPNTGNDEVKFTVK